MNLIARRKFFYLSCICFLVFSLTHCSAEEDLKNTIIDNVQDSQDELVNPLDIEELKKSAMAFTFEDIKSMSVEEMKSVMWSEGSLWFKDFYNWELNKLSDKKIEFILLKIAQSNHLSDEDVNEVVISEEKNS